MAAPFATPAELLALHPDLSAQPAERLEACLAYVSAAIRRLCDAESVDADVLKLVACQASARMLPAEGGVGVTQESWSATPYSGSVSYANPSGDVYLTGFEQRLLGISGADMEAVFVTPGEACRGDGDHV